MIRKDLWKKTQINSYIFDDAWYNCLPFCSSSQLPHGPSTYSHPRCPQPVCNGPCEAICCPQPLGDNFRDGHVFDDVCYNDFFSFYFTAAPRPINVPTLPPWPQPVCNGPCEAICCPLPLGDDPRGGHVFDDVCYNDFLRLFLQLLHDPSMYPLCHRGHSLSVTVLVRPSAVHYL